MNQKIDVVKDALEQRIDMVEVALDTEINHVYLIATENKNNIEHFLIPLSDRIFHANEEIAKIPMIEERMGYIETVVGEHSRAIRSLVMA